METMTTTTAYHEVTNQVTEELTETSEELNIRYADALLPFAVILGLFCVVGIFGNLLVITIFSVSQEYRNTNFRVFVICLAIVDLLSCCILMPIEILKTRQFFNFTNPYLCKVKCFFNMFAMNAAAYVLLVICIDRYRKVCQPLKKQIFPGLAVKILMAVMFGAFMLSVPAPILCGIQKENVTNIYNTTTVVAICSAEEKYHHSPLRYIYKFGLSIALAFVSVAFVIMYVLIVRAVIKHRNKRCPGESIRFETNKQRGHYSTEGSADNIYVKVHLVVTPVNGCQDENQVLQVPVNQCCQLKFTALNKGSNNNRSNTSLCSLTSKSRLFINRSVSETSLRNRSVRRCTSSSYGRFPYKTLIWLTLTLIFLLSFLIFAGLSFLTLKEHTFSPSKLLWFQIFFRLYFVNHIINPVVYAILDKRFKSSCRRLAVNIKDKLLDR